MNIFLFDTETNGFGANNEIISIGYMMLTDFKVVEKNYVLFNRGDIALKWNPDAQRIHKISAIESVEKGVLLEDHLPTIANKMFMADKIVAHNIKFDMGVMERALNDIGKPGAKIWENRGRICTLQTARKYARVNEKSDLKSTFFRLYPNQPKSVWDGHHNAEFDTRMLANIFVKMVKKKWIKL